MFNPEILSKNIKICRTKLGLTQTELAERLFVSGQAISKWESGQTLPDLSNLCTLSEIFSTSLDKLTGNIVKSDDGKAFIGIDGGATKTEFVLFSDNGDILKRVVLDGCNPNACGIDKAFSVLKTGIDSLLAVRHDVAGVFCGNFRLFQRKQHSTAQRAFFQDLPTYEHYALK